MFLLVGVDHIIQHGGYLDEKKKAALEVFHSYLCEVTSKYSIDLIAEEFSEFLLAMNNTSFCTCREVACHLSVEHRFCDPNPNERIDLSIETNEQREQEWLRRLDDAKSKHILFVCGSSHLESFSNLLKKNDVESMILSDRWGYDYLGKGPVQHFKAPCDTSQDV